MLYDEEDYELRAKWRQSNKLDDKRQLACFGFDSDVRDLMHNPRWSQDKKIKEAIIIKHGMYLDQFVHDPDEDIRAAVASKHRDEDLEILVYDPSVKVREMVAVNADCAMNTSKYFDILVNDESPDVRLLVAMKVSCYGKPNNPYLDILVHDPAPIVRKEVAHYAIKEHLDILVNDPDEEVREAVARWGHRPKDLNKLAKDPSPIVRKEVAKQGRDRNLDTLVHDPDPAVREAVAQQGRDCDLDILVHDPDWHVRKAVAQHGRKKDLDQLIDPNEEVRTIVDKMRKINDENEF